MHKTHVAIWFRVKYICLSIYFVYIFTPAVCKEKYGYNQNRSLEDTNDIRRPQQTFNIPESKSTQTTRLHTNINAVFLGFNIFLNK